MEHVRDHGDIYRDLSEPATAIKRRRDRDIWLHFEYFIVNAQDCRASHPEGVYPSDLRRIDVNDPCLAADKGHVESP
ncbi:MAG: hypothetical protein JO194_01910 [Candidatus Eremiobacteraeota bacterium]|nr:hypothetical protein [Candidatus Eremiobacteraeota bacterium]